MGCLACRYLRRVDTIAQAYLGTPSNFRTPVNCINGATVGATSPSHSRVAAFKIRVPSASISAASGVPYKPDAASGAVDAGPDMASEGWRTCDGGATQWLTSCVCAFQGRRPAGKGLTMLFLILLLAAAMVVTVGALQNGQAVTVSFLFWQFESPLALIILAAAAGGVAIATLVGWAHALRRWRDRPVGPALECDASASDRLPGSSPSAGTRIRP